MRIVYEGLQPTPLRVFGGTLSKLFHDAMSPNSLDAKIEWLDQRLQGATEEKPARNRTGDPGNPNIPENM